MARERLVDSRFPVRKNLVLTPRVATTFSGWNWSAGTGETGTTTQVTGAADGPILPNGRKIASYLRRTITAPKTGGSTGFQIGGVSTIPLVTAVGDRLAASLWVRSSVATSISGFRVQARSGTTNVGLQDSGPIALAAGVWTRLAVANMAGTIVSPGDNVLLWPYQSSAVIQPPSTFDATAAMVERGTVPDVYLDGASGNAKWDGTADASTSTGNGWAGRI